MVNVFAIASATPSGIIGTQGVNELLWSIPEDLAHFRDKTLGKTLIMGRATYESIGCRLSGRETIVVTNQEKYKCPYENSPLYYTSDKYEALGYAEEIGNDVFVAGGEQIYNMFLPVVDVWHITRVYGSYSHKVSSPAFLPEEVRVEGSESEDWYMYSKSTPTPSDGSLSYSLEELRRRSLTASSPCATVYS